jgi:hypothetical protein
MDVTNKRFFSENRLNTVGRFTKRPLPAKKAPNQKEKGPDKPAPTC